MSRISFDKLPDDARVWVFGASESITHDAEKELLSAVDEWLDQWTAHGEPLTCAREWRDNRFLIVGVDQRTAGASGCSIDALFRLLQGIQGSLGTDFLGSGRVFYRSGPEAILSTDRASFRALASQELIDESTRVFDVSVTTAGAYRTGFEKALGDSWHRDLLNASV